MTMADLKDNREYVEKRAQIHAILEELVLDAILEALEKIKEKKWVNQKKPIQKELQF
jgi:hypothetical protein